MLYTKSHPNQHNTNRILSLSTLFAEARQKYTLPSYVSIANLLDQYFEINDLINLYFDVFKEKIELKQVKGLRWLECKFLNRVDRDLFPLDMDAMYLCLEDSSLSMAYIVPMVYGHYFEDTNELFENDPAWILIQHFDGYPSYEEAFYQRLASLPEPYSGIAVEYLLLTQDTGNIFIDWTMEGLYNDLLPSHPYLVGRWSVTCIEALAQQWKDAKPLIERMETWRGAYSANLISYLKVLIFDE
jgi:hypothetical protein